MKGHITGLELAKNLLFKKLARMLFFLEIQGFVEFYNLLICMYKLAVTQGFLMIV